MRIYLNQSLVECIGQQIDLPDAQARHVGKVMRARVGQSLVLFNGRGEEVAARVDSVERRRVVVSLLESRAVMPESPLQVHLGQVISKGDRMDYVVQKATELGVSSITPLYSARADVRLDAAREAKKLEHWRNVAISACEQCGRGWLPEVASPQGLDDWLAQRHEPLKLVLHPQPAGNASDIPAFDPDVSRETALLVGPEGGLEEGEVAAAIRHGFVPRVFGPRILRTETAPVVALSILQHLYGDF